MPAAEEYSNKRTSTSHARINRLNRMVFELMKEPATFWDAREIIVNKFSWTSCPVYLDDTIIFVKSSD